MEPLKSLISRAQGAQEARDAREAELRGMTPEEANQAKREAESRKRRASAIMASGIRFRGDQVAVVADGKHRTTTAVEAVRGWRTDGDGERFLLLSGGVGTGKTMAAAVAIADYGGGCCIRAANLARRVHPTYADTLAGYDPPSLSGFLVVLDDLGTEVDHRSGRWAEAFSEFMEQRGTFGRTIITSNLRRAEVLERYGDRIGDRLADDLLAVELGGKSLRKGGRGL